MVVVMTGARRLLCTTKQKMGLGSEAGTDHPHRPISAEAGSLWSLCAARIRRRAKFAPELLSSSRTCQRLLLSRIIILIKNGLWCW